LALLAGTVGIGLLSVSAAGAAGAAARPATSGAAAMSSVVKTATVARYGKILEDSKGLALYYDTANRPPSHWACTAGCLAAWPPLVLPKGHKATAPMGVTGISAIKGPSGEQVTWKGKPLYTYVGDSAGKVTGQGIGRIWYVVQLGSKSSPKLTSGAPKVTTTTQAGW
jgi:predicted lipoprotein with Yx(FWY)xxD motif